MQLRNPQKSSEIRKRDLETATAMQSAENNAHDAASVESTAVSRLLNWVPINNLSLNLHEGDKLLKSSSYSRLLLPKKNNLTGMSCCLLLQDLVDCSRYTGGGGG
jgi:hypothetical protein